jgi:hypothetical protein
MRGLLGEDSELGEADEEPFSAAGIVGSAPRTCATWIDNTRTKDGYLQDRQYWQPAVPCLFGSVNQRTWGCRAGLDVI